MSDKLPKTDTLLSLFDSDIKKFEIVNKHYYDLFAYHATQRLTTFNFFIVSLSFFSSAYALLLTRSSDAEPHYGVAGILSFAAYLLILAFSRLDARNEQIIETNEIPLRHIQAIFSEKFGDKKWQSFERTTEIAEMLGTYGKLLPYIYCGAALVAMFGALFSIQQFSNIENIILIVLLILGCILTKLIIFSWRPAPPSHT